MAFPPADPTPPAKAVRPRRMFFPKVTGEMLLMALDSHLKPSQRAVILSDGYESIDGAVADLRVRRVIDVRHEPVAALDQLDEHDVVIYACTQDDLGMPFVRRLHDSGRRYYPIWSARPGGYSFANSLARRVLEEEFTHQKQHGFGKWDFGHRDFENLIQAVEITRNLPGCYLEVGCYCGSSAGVALRYLAESNRPMETFFLDVFEGFTYRDSESSADAVWHGTHVTDGLESVRARLEAYGAGHTGLAITVDRCNIITDPLPARVLELGIAVANLDVDLHEAVYAGLHKIAPHVVPGGILVVEDAGHTPLLIGAKLALELFLGEGIGEQFTPIAMESGQTFLIRR